MTTKEEYKQLCQQEDMPLFMQDWWLGATCAGLTWDIIFVRDDKGAVKAAMPYILQKKWWQRYVTMPNLCPYGGAWIRPDLRDSFSEAEAIAKELDEQLKGLKVNFFHQRFAIGSRLPEALIPLGYKSIARCTYTLDDVQDLNQVLDGFSKNKRKKLEKKTLTYKLGEIDPEQFYRFHSLCNAEKNKELWYSRETFLVLYEKSQALGQSKLICVQDENGEPLAAAFVVWDKQQLYQLLNCYVHEDKDNGAREMLTFEVIKFARSLGLGVDFVCHRNYLRHYGAVRKDFWAAKRSKSALISSSLFFNKLFDFRHRKL